MTEIAFDSKNEVISISSYDGSNNDENYTNLHLIKRVFKNHSWDFFRKGSNHAYVNGGAVYYENCRNNLIISFYKNNKLSNIKNAFIVLGNSHVYVTPIFNLKEIIRYGKKILSSNIINYNIPESVFKRENLSRKHLTDIYGFIKDKYGIKSREIKPIFSVRTKEGIYHIKDINGHEYVMKYRGREKEQAELLSLILATIPNYFPNIHPLDGNPRYTFEIGDELYGLEDYIKGDSLKMGELEYLSLLGPHIKLLHQELENFSNKKTDIEKILSSKGRDINESDIASIYLDLSTNSQKHDFLLLELNQIIDKNLKEILKSLPSSLIHRDLNHSNILWMDGKPKIVDPETIGFSMRINEFIAPLLLRENMERPSYFEGGISKLIGSYNESNKNPLSKDEISVLPSILKYALLKYYTIRTIRRNVKDDDYLSKLEKNLNDLGALDGN